MVMQLLPASAKAFAERSGPNVVLGSKAEQWLTLTLKRVNKVKRPLNNVSQHQRCLEDILSGEQAIWLLASTVLPKYPEAQMKKAPNEDTTLCPSFAVESILNYDMINIEGYVVHVDMVSQREVAFKLTQSTINTLIKYHKDVFSVDTAAQVGENWPEKPKHVQKLHDDFVQAINGYVFRTEDRALEGLEEEGTGELLENRANKVRVGVDALFKKLKPPAPKIFNLMGPPGFAYWQTQYAAGGYYAQYTQQYYPQYAPQYPQPQYAPPPPVEPWRLLSSTPTSAISYHSDVEPAQQWPQPAPPVYTQPQPQPQLPSPTPSYNQAPSFTTSSPYQSQYPYGPPTPSPISLPLPSSLLAQQNCGSPFGGYYSSFDNMPLTPMGGMPIGAF